MKKMKSLSLLCIFIVSGALVCFLPTSAPAQSPASAAAADSQQAGVKTTEVNGAVVAVSGKTSRKQTITLMVNGQKIVIPIAPACVVLVQRGSQTSVQGHLSDVRPGDLARVLRQSSSGGAIGIRIAFDETVGVVKSVSSDQDGTRTITFNNGASVQLIGSAAVLQGQREAAWADVAPGKSVSVRIDQDLKLGYAVKIGGAETKTSGAVEAPPMTTPPIEQNHPKISTFAFTPKGPFKAGDLIHLIFQSGERKQKVSATIQGVVRTPIPLKETTPGIYRADYIIPPDLFAKDAVFAVQAGSRHFVDIKRLSIDSKPLIITPVSPYLDATSVTTPLITALIRERGIGIDPASVLLSIDGRDFSRQTAVSQRVVSLMCHTPVTSGPHRVHLELSDKIGNKGVADWTFVADHGSKLISSLTIIPPNGQLNLAEGDKLGVRLEGSPQGTASFSIAGVTGEIPMKETLSGQYEAEVAITAGMSVRHGYVDGRLITKEGQIASASSRVAVEIKADAPEAPKSLLVTEGSFPHSVSISGKTKPGAEALVFISKRILDDQANKTTEPNIVASSDAIADDQGNWKTEPIILKWGEGESRLFFVNAFTVDANGGLSASESVQFKAK
jgi:hypothetical protein